MELVWEHVTCVCLCVCAWTFIHVQVLRREWQRYVPTDTKGAYDMSRFRLNVHSLSESLWKDCLNVFQVWYFLQGSWNHQLANQPYYGRWCVILLLKRNLNCLTLTLFFRCRSPLLPSEIWKSNHPMANAPSRYWQLPPNILLIAIVASSFDIDVTHLFVKLAKPPAAGWWLSDVWLFVIHRGSWSSWCSHLGGSGRRTSNCLKMLPCAQTCWSHSWLLHLTGVSKIERQASGTQVLQHFGT